MINVEVKAVATGKVGVDNHYAEISWITPCNISLKGAKEYFKVGSIINNGLWYDSVGNEHEDDLMRIVSCELVSEN